MRSVTLLDDLRALGWGAPVRVGYEVAKRAGAHAVLLRPDRAASGAPPPRGPLAPPPVLPDPPSTAVERALGAATEILEGRVTLFGQPVEVGAQTDWLRAPDTGRRWPSTHWWTIDIRSGVTPGEIKQIWELGRARHLVLLARVSGPAGAAADPPTARAARRRLEADLRAWFDQNPPEVGIHWYSNLELSLRVLVWTEILARVPDLDTALVARIRTTLPVIARHQLVELPYTLSTMRNNHLLGDALGMVAIGHLLPLDRWARRAGMIGRHLWARQLERQVRADGSMLEDSVSYHRFVVEMLVWRLLLDGDPATRQALARAVGWLVRLGTLDGPVPQIGDWDEGRLLATTQPADDLAGTTRLGLLVGGSPSRGPLLDTDTDTADDWRASHDECAWYAPAATRNTVRAPSTSEELRGEQDGADIGGGVARVARGSLQVWLKAGSGPSHGHADLCSVSVRDGAFWVVSDPGTGTYNGPLEVRTWFRSSIAHSVLRVRSDTGPTGTPPDDDQLGPHRAFRWRRTARGRVGPPVRVGERVVLWGAHDAYRGRGGRLARALVVSPDDLWVTDWVEHHRGRGWELSLPLAPGTVWNAGRISGPAGRWLLEAPEGAALSVNSGARAPFDGWWSTTLERWEPATRLALSGRLDGPVRWGLHRSETDGGARPPDLELTWTDVGATLRVHHGQLQTTAYLTDLPARRRGRHPDPWGAVNPTCGSG